MQTKKFSPFGNTETRGVSNTERKQFFSQFRGSNRPESLFSGGVYQPRNPPAGPVKTH